jgi:cellulose synthase/poly-beta-1,6-N-acetylglucosamine synthase-like glycosyltransferase
LSAPAVSVLVPVLDEAADIRATAEAMLAQRLDEPHEVLFVDGGSTDGTPKMLAELAAADPRVRLLDNPQRRIAPALNIGLRAARAPVVARMDAHTHYPPDYLARGLERLRRGDVAWVSGPQLAYGVDAGSRRVALALTGKLGTGGANFRHAKTGEIDGKTGFTGVFDRAWLERVGGWDESWVVNEDAELAARVRQAGGRIVIVPEMAARYVPRRTLRALGRQYLRYGIFRAKTCKAHPESMDVRQALPPALVATAAVALSPVRLPLVRPLARLGVAAYAGALLLAARRAAGEAPAADAAAVPAVLVTMHGAWGTGFAIGCARFGFPFAAFARLLTRA